MMIQLDLTETEVRYLSNVCILRVIKSAIEAVPSDYEYLGDLEDAKAYEDIRRKIVNQLRRS